MQNSCNPLHPRNMFCFRYIIVNTLHKGDNKDDDDNDNVWSDLSKNKGYLEFILWTNQRNGA